MEYNDPRTFEKLVLTPLVEFQGWGPTFFSKLCAIENCSGRFRDWFLFSSCSFHPCLGWRFHVTFPRWVEARRWLKADFHQRTTCASWSRFPGASIPGRSADIWSRQPLERSAMKSSGCDHHIIQRWCWQCRTCTGAFVSSFHNKYEATQDILFRTDWRKSSDIYQTSFAPCMLTIPGSKSGMRWTQQA